MRTDVHSGGKKKQSHKGSVICSDCYQFPPAADFHGDTGHRDEVIAMPGEARPSKEKSS